MMGILTNCINFSWMATMHSGDHQECMFEYIWWHLRLLPESWKCDNLKVVWYCLVNMGMTWWGHFQDVWDLIVNLSFFNDGRICAVAILRHCCCLLQIFANQCIVHLWKVYGGLYIFIVKFIRDGHGVTVVYKKGCWTRSLCTQISLLSMKTKLTNFRQK